MQARCQGVRRLCASPLGNSASWKILLVHLTPQKLAWKATAAKDLCGKLRILPVAPAWSFYLVLHLRQQICLLQWDMWRKRFLVVTRKWCSSNSFQTCSKEESICKAEGTKLGHILPKKRWFLSLIWSSSTETWLFLLRLSLGSYFLEKVHAWRSECSELDDITF